MHAAPDPLPVEVPPPVPPDAPDAWYAPAVRQQYAVHPGVVATVREADDGFRYDLREPSLGAAETDALDAVRAHFADVDPTRPRTREGVVERAAAGLGGKHRRIVRDLADCSRAGRRRVRYHVMCDLRCLGPLTPYALDGRVEVADAASVDRDGGRLVVHTADFAPVRTGLRDPPYLDRFLSERLARYAVPFEGFDVPVVVYRERLLGRDAFDVKYAVEEPDLVPGDRALIDECKDRIWEANVDGVIDTGDGGGPSWRHRGDVVTDRAAFVRGRARRFLSRRLTARNTRAWLDAAAYRARTALAEYGLAVPPVDRRFAADRLDDLVYHVLRDLVGHGPLTIPIRDPGLEDVEANRVGERVKVVPRGADLGRVGRVPTNLAFDDERTFVALVRQLAAEDGVELNSSNPSAKVNLRPAEVADDVTIRCAVALPVVSEDGPHVSIRKQAPEALTPVDLLRAGSLPTEVVALLWLAYEHHGVVLFSGPTGAGKTTLMNAHMPFVAFDDRPVSIDEGSREVRLPHETGVSLTTRDHEDPYKRVTMADLMTEANYLNPDVEVIAEVNTPESFETFGEVLNTGHGVVGTTHAPDVETLVNRVVERGLPAYLLREVDLVVFPRFVDGDRYVGEVVELVTDDEYASLDGDRGTVEKGGTPVRWHRVARRTHDGGFEVADPARVAFLDRLAARTDRPVEAVRDEFQRKHRYVRYMRAEGLDDFEAVFAFLADLRTDEAATVERVRRRLAAGDRA